MRGIDKPAGRVVALIVLLGVVAASLRGYLPDSEHTSHEHARHPAAQFFNVALLSAALLIVAVAVIARLRDRRTAAGSLAGLAEGTVGRGERPNWRVVLIGLGAIVGWLLIVALLVHWVDLHGIGQHGTDPGSPTGAPGADTVAPATDTAPARPQPPQQRPNGHMLGYLAAGAVGLLLLLVAALVVGARNRPRPTESPPNAPDVPAASSDSLVRAAELGLAEIGDPGRGPREAIIACYATMERELACVPDVVPQDCDTPTEVLARAVEHRALHADNAARLVELFTEARFSPHLMNEGHREAAVRVLRLVLEELPRGVS